MSKYNAGDKFIIEVEEKCVGDFKTEGTTELYRIKGFKSLVFDKNGLDKLQKVNSKVKIEDIDDMLAEYDLKKESYEKGLQDAWELARKIFSSEEKGGYSAEELDEIFGFSYLAQILWEYTPQEAIAKIESYEQEQEIKMGDEVENPNNPKKYIVCNIKTGASISTDLRETALLELSCWQKTGKHIDIQQILDGIGAD